MSPNIFTVRTNKELFRSSIEHVPVVTDFLHFCFACCCFACCFVFVSLTYTHNTYASFMQFSSNLMYHCCDDDNNVVSILVTLSVSLSYTLSAGTHSYALAPFGKTTATFAQTHEHTRRQSVKYKYHLNHLTWSMVFFAFFFFFYFLLDFVLYRFSRTTVVLLLFLFCFFRHLTFACWSWPGCISCFRWIFLILLVKHGCVLCCDAAFTVTVCGGELCAVGIGRPLFVSVWDEDLQAFVAIDGN